MKIPTCPSDLSPNLLNPLQEFARAWAASPLRPRPEQKFLAHWQSLVTDWATCDDLPLFVRKLFAGRGQAVPHHTGRMLVPVDNSPPHWSFTLALSGNCPSLDDVRNLLKKDQIPVAMILKKSEKELAQYRCTRTHRENLNEFGWKLGHIEGVGLNDRKPVTELPIEILKQHFIRLMSPSNMFLMPLSLEGLAEVPVVIEEIRRFQKDRR